MGYQDCIIEVEKAVGRKLQMDEAEAIFEAVQQREKYARANSTAESIEAAIKGSADELAKQIVRAAKIEKRNAALQFMRRAEALDYIMTQFKDKPELGMESLLVGTNIAKVGARFSVAAKQNEILARYLTGLSYDLDAANVLHIFTSGEFDRELSRALYAIENPNVPEYKGLEDVKKTAEIINKWKETIRAERNDQGAAIDKIDGHIIRQTHDQNKIRAEGAEKWTAFIMDKLDLTRTFDDGVDPKEVLNKIYNSFVSGYHLQTKKEVTGFKGGTMNLAKKASQDRVLHFKDADSWYDYHEKFGIGSISESITFSMQNAAQDIGLMSKLGPNPRDNWNRITDYIKSSLRKEPEKLASFIEETKRNGTLDRIFAEVDGTSRIAVDGMLARIGSGVRVLETTSKLGGALVSSVTDIATIMTEMRYQGHDMFGAMEEAITSIMKGQQKSAFKEIDAGLGVIADSMRGELSGARGWAEDNLPGTLSKIQMSYFKLNGLTWWTDTLRATVIRLMSHMSALNKGLPFEKLSAELQRVYGLYGIDAGKWDIIRQTSTKALDGREYLVPSAINDLPKSVFENYLTSIGKNPTDLAVKNIREEIRNQFSTYFHDRADFAVLQPDAKTRAILHQGQQQGTPTGELLRLVTQFKSFPTAFVHKVLGREIYGRGVEASTKFIDALKNGNGEIEGLAQQFIWSTLFGYIAYNAKDLLKGRTTKEPESAADYAKIVQASILQGGGLGIIGDYMFGEMKNRYGAGPLSGAMGPAFGTAESILDLYGRAKNGDDLAGAAVRTVINNTPFANLFYTRMAIDYLITYRIQESLNPGYLSRMEALVSKEQGKTFIFPPSQYVR